MANQEQLEILRQGVDTWNKWRRENPLLDIDLSGANLLYVHLSRAKLSRASLSGAILWGVHLVGTDLIEANLSNAQLKGANLNKAKLRGADLTGADLIAAIVREADLRGSIFFDATVAATAFENSDMSQAIGLENVIHRGPSSISTDTIALSKGRIPEVFLRGCGLSDWEIESVKLYNPDLSNNEFIDIQNRIFDLRHRQALQISSLFISYSHADGKFVDKLEGYLNRKGIRFWRDIHDAKSGRLEKQIDRAMHLNPTVLLILSENSIKSDWVEHEVRTARELEKELERDVLCPVALDNNWKNSSWPKRVMEQVMEYNILDFSAWEDDRKFGNIFNKLIDGLELFYK